MPSLPPLPRAVRARHAAALLAAAALVLPATAPANDSEAEWALGGLALKQNDAISMDAEDLYVSAEAIRVNYTYTNHSDAAQKVLVSFPIPALPGNNPGWVEYGSFPDWKELQFSTTVDGKPAKWDVAERAVAGGKDVTALVKAEKFPLAWYQDSEFIEKIGALPPAEVKRLAALGLVKRAEGEEWGGNGWMPGWQVQYHITREQTFPAHATVRVAHRYTPLAGGSVGGVLHAFAQGELADVRAAYEKKYCIDKAFLSGVDKRQKQETARHGEGGSGSAETWIGYVLSSGANWRGPIGDFRLVVDKGKPDNLVSFCMDGVKKISPTQFEVRKKNYEPDRDLNVLIVQWYSFGN